MCTGSMYSGQGPTKQKHKALNSTTIHFKVVNITENRTYSCHCENRKDLDPCGLDISAGCEYSVSMKVPSTETFSPGSWILGSLFLIRKSQQIDVE